MYSEAKGYAPDAWEFPCYPYDACDSPAEGAQPQVSATAQYPPIEAYYANATDECHQPTYGCPLAVQGPTVTRDAVQRNAVDTICFFGGPCAHLTPDSLRASIPAVRKHLEEYHDPASVLARGSTGKVKCQWDDGGGRCGQPISNLVKHVATLHLKLFQVRAGARMIE
ncbi:hypothetical protein EVJ58_g1805 [Rhodofomes roseus]|uniref:Uncharacterized protein n=1 Tax=Rhodofomes roseus TaxID=34475 RepID=A0A4Y9YZI7_9APHY|nr:hypothetical protein EVJ58_g1805 [Rhodofomes roseus]